jgi:hypothetical protein
MMKFVTMSNCLALVLTVFCFTETGRAAEKLPTVLVRAPHHAYHNAVVTAALPAGLTPGQTYTLQTAADKKTLPCQTVSAGAQTFLTFVLPDLPQGAERVYSLHADNTSATGTGGVRVTEINGDIEISTGGSLFTRYTTHSGPNKPFFYPLLTPDGDPITRRWPIEQTTGESHDHIHHRGLWFTHGDVNGIDFWSEGPKTGKTVNIGFQNLTSGPVCGGFRALTDWQAPDGKVIARDTRDVLVYLLPNGDRLMDFTITVHPVGGPLTFGDTKEGTFGLRVADSLAPSRKQGGHILNSQGLKDSAVWAQKADWVDYSGPIQGKTYGVAIFDAPSNLRHPETWHARDYGLFAVNPFGLRDFGLGPQGAGNYTVAPGKTLRLHYRLLFHRGDAQAADVADQYAAFADPPEVQVR